MNYPVDQGDRRGSNRFPIERAVRFKALNRRSDGDPGRGRTVNMSSTGVLFTCDQELKIGRASCRERV